MAENLNNVFENNELSDDVLNEVAGGVGSNQGAKMRTSKGKLFAVNETRGVQSGAVNETRAAGETK